MCSVQLIIRIVTSTLVIFCSLVLSDLPSKFQCPPDWKFLEVSKKCIFVRGDYLMGDFYRNEKLCRYFNSSMLVIDSSKELEEIRDILKDYSTNRFWLGGKTVDKNGTFILEWKPPKYNNYSNWSPNSPNCQPSSYCCVLSNSKSLWTDVNCYTIVPMVCQKPPEENSIEKSSTIDCNFSSAVDCFMVAIKIFSTYNHNQISTTLINMYRSLITPAPELSEILMIPNYNRARKEKVEILEILINFTKQFDVCIPSNESQCEPTNDTQSNYGISLDQKSIIGAVKLTNYSFTASIILTIVITSILTVWITLCISNRRSSKRKKQDQLLTHSPQWSSRCSDSAFD